MSDVRKIAETLGLARMRRDMFACANTAGLDAIQRAKLDAEYCRALRDLSICEMDLMTAIAQGSK
jgi:hypothetical protein